MTISLHSLRMHGFATSLPTRTRTGTEDFRRRRRAVEVTNVSAPLSLGGGHAEEKMRAALEDPDFTATLENAVYGSARTNSRERHKVLATIVAERLKADGGGVKASASNMAVEILPRLAGVHLEWLGLLAVIYTIRADWLIPDEAHADENWMQQREAVAPFASRYIDWLRDQLRPYRHIGDFSDSIAASLHISRHSRAQYAS